MDVWVYDPTPVTNLLHVWQLKPIIRLQAAAIDPRQLLARTAQPSSTAEYHSCLLTLPKPVNFEWKHAINARGVIIKGTEYNWIRYCNRCTSHWLLLVCFCSNSTLFPLVNPHCPVSCFETVSKYLAKHQKFYFCFYYWTNVSIYGCITNIWFYF